MSFQPYMRNHITLLWDGALLTTLFDTRKEPTLLVAGVDVLTFEQGRAWRAGLS